MIDFIKYSKLYALISAIFLSVGIFSIVVWGFNFSIDFTGGSVIEYRVSPTKSTQEVRKIAEKQKISASSITTIDKDVLIKTESINEKQELDFRNTLAKELSTKVTMLRFESVGPSLGRETIRKTIIASVVGTLAILLYVSFTFKKLTYGLSAIIALVHDVIILFGFYSLVTHFFGGEVDALFITSVLTTMSFSVHDTIVVSDKIREIKRTSGLPLSTIANKALTETMVRSINNSLTIILMLLALVLLGADTIRSFAIALLIGTITGTYSSPFVATPLLVFMESRKKEYNTMQSIS